MFGCCNCWNCEMSQPSPWSTNGMGTVSDGQFPPLHRNNVWNGSALMWYHYGTSRRPSRDSFLSKSSHCDQVKFEKHLLWDHRHILYIFSPQASQLKLFFFFFSFPLSFLLVLLFFPTHLSLTVSTLALRVTGGWTEMKLRKVWLFVCHVPLHVFFILS